MPKFHLDKFFKILLFIVLILSFLHFIDSVFLEGKNYPMDSKFSTWQFPMLLALFIDAIYY